VLARLRTYWPGGSTLYIEPFAGSASLFFAIGPERAILSDLNGELIQTMQAIRADVAAVILALRKYRQGESTYYSVRNLSPTQLPGTEAAARFIYLNRNCFNGLYRTNLLGQFNVPYGPPRSGRWDRSAFEELLRQAAQVLQRATLIHADFAATVSRARKGDFVFLDPPYAVGRRRVFREYIPASFGAIDLPRLKECLEALDSRGAKFVITYADCRESRHLLGTWNPRRIWTRRNIAGFAGQRRGHYELVATNSITGDSL
jgi:DNA adenine methylase